MKQYEFNKHGTIIHTYQQPDDAKTKVCFYCSTPIELTSCIRDRFNGSIGLVQDDVTFGHVSIHQSETSNQVASEIAKTFIRAGIYWGTYELKQI